MILQPPQGLITAADLVSGAVLGTAMLEPSGEVVVPVNGSRIPSTALPEYSYITATYSGDGHYAASSSACPDRALKLADLFAA